MQRKCGECQLCCRLLPMSAETNKSAQQTADLMLASGMVDRLPFMMPDFDKPAGCRCPHQQHGKGCAVYRRRPFGCRMWSCAWLVGEDLPRPDHCHYVIDTVPDIIQIGDDSLPVVQVWCDRRYPDAWRDPRLLKYLEAKAKDIGAAALIRYSENKAVAVFPPTLTGAGWVVRDDPAGTTVINNTLRERWAKHLGM